MMADLSVAQSYPELQQFIGGEWRGGGDGVAGPVLDPATGAAIGDLPRASTADLDDALATSQAAFETWRRTPAIERSAVLVRAAALLRENAEANAIAMTLEQGKPLAEARGEFAMCPETFEWYAAEGLRNNGRFLPSRAAGTRQLVLPEPVGPVAAFTPWNFPANLAARKIAPALAAGCTMILKPSEETPASAMALAGALDAAGLPKGVLNIVHGEPQQISEQLIRSQVIRKVTLTGSVGVGRQVAALAGKMLKPCTLELGGHAAVIVFDDADLDHAVATCAIGKLRNAGQVCTSPTRFLVQDAIHDEFVRRLAEAFGKVVVGSGLDPETQMGPLANERRVEAIASLVAAGREAGARVVTGGERIGKQGYFFQPTILSDTPITAAPMNEEPFGPLALVNRFSTPEEAVAEANRLPFGLAAYAFTRSAPRAMMVSEELHAGGIGINSFAVVQIEAPFGGTKDSGYGYEGGSEGLAGYVHSKYVNHV